MRKLRSLVVLILAVLLSVNSSLAQEKEVVKQTYKYQRLMALIDAFYVDKQDVEKLTETAIVKILSELDPHSVYISKDEVKDMNEPLQGGFFGIGIQFNILRDTLMVVATVPGGPSEKVGLMAGDRIVNIDGENIAGTGLKNSGVRKRLKGEEGTLVKLKVKRASQKGILDFNIIRDKIPLYSIDASYMIDNNIGYIKLSRFAATSIEEFEKALKKLQAQGMKDLIFDLQGNSGGFLGAAIGIADHFLDNNKLIVYTEGRVAGRRNSNAVSRGYFEKGRLAILIDEGSASASEIVSGAIQDWDRGVIVGHRSFGKGLVQRQFPLTDSSMVRLTVSHYYTPTGRCIQKPYNKGLDDYRLDILKRYSSGELTNPDSIHFADSLKYKTLLKKRTVYGGGGIMPDVFVPIDTTVNYSYFNRLLAANVIYPWVVDYVDKNRETLVSKYPTFSEFNKKFNVDSKMLSQIVAAGEKAKLKKDTKHYDEIIPSLKIRIKALIARDLWDMNELQQVLNKRNKILNKAVELLKNDGYSKIMN